MGRTKREDGQEGGALWLVLVEKKESSRKLKKTGFKVTGKAEGVSQEIQRRENLHKEASVVLSVAELSNKV